MRRGIPFFFARGGGSRGLILFEEDLTSIPRSQWLRLFGFWLGSPDPTGRQVDGFGGGNPSTSKVVVLSRSDAESADFNYDFYQVDPVTGDVEKRGTCANLMAASALVVLSEERIPVDSPEKTVRLLDTNTRKVSEVEVPLAALPTPRHIGAPFLEVDYSERVLTTRFLSPEGATAGRLFPTGADADQVSTRSERVTASLIDAVNPVVLVEGRDVGISPDDSPYTLETNADLMALMQSLRSWGATALGFAESIERAPEQSAFLPFVGMAFSPQDYITLGGTVVSGSEIDLVIRMLSGVTVHRALPLSAGLATAVWASRGETEPGSRVVRLGHPSGVLEVIVERGEDEDGLLVVTSISVDTTARIIAQGYLRTE